MTARATTERRDAGRARGIRRRGPTFEREPASARATLLAVMARRYDRIVLATARLCR